MNRRTLLAGLAIAAAPAPVLAQSLNFDAAAAYSAERRGVSVLVLHRGRVAFEDYPNDGAPARGWPLWSGTKSFTGVMAAAAVQDRLLELDEPAADTLSEWRGDARARITIAHLLSLTSGLAAGLGQRPPSYADAVRTPAGAPPGAHFQYGPVSFQIFGEIMRRKLDGDPLAYLTRRILDPIGIAPTEWRRGRDGNPLMPQGASFTARDWAQFGKFVIDGGRGQVDRDALARCFQPSRANPGYGLSFWLLREGLIGPSERAMPIEIDPAALARLGEVNMAAGAGDQRLYLMAERDLVVARQATGLLRSFRARGDARWSDAAFLRALLEA
jgi:CubicO group peptidase (beta-lactamase class C family)